MTHISHQTVGVWPCNGHIMHGSGGGLGSRPQGPDPLEKYKNIVFLAILVQIPRKITKLPSYQASIYCRVSIGTLVGRWWPAVSVIWILCPSLINSKKTLSELDSLWQNFLEQRMHIIILSYNSLNTIVEIQYHSHFFHVEMLIILWALYCLMLDFGWATVSQLGVFFSSGCMWFKSTLLCFITVF